MQGVSVDKNKHRSALSRAKFKDLDRGAVAKAGFRDISSLMQLFTVKAISLRSFT